MNRDPLDSELSEALRQKTDSASTGFTAEVLARLGDRPTRSPMMARPALAGATALVLLVLGITLGLNFGGSSAPTPEAADERERLIREYRELQQELDQIRQLADESSPVLYLGGDETFDVMYDLRGYESVMPTGNVRPVSLPPDRG